MRQGPGVISVGPPLGVDPMGQMRLRIKNKQTYIPKKDTHLLTILSDWCRSYLHQLHISLLCYKCISLAGLDIGACPIAPGK